GVPTNVPVNVVADQTTNVTVNLVGLGTVQVQVNFAGGSPAANSPVDIFTTNFFRFVGSTNANGSLQVPNIPVGVFTVRAFNPNNSNIFTDVVGTIPSAGAVVPVTVTLQGTGVVTGNVSRASGQPAVNSFVEVLQNFRQVGTASTDSNGNYSVAQVPTGTVFTVRAHNPNNFSSLRSANGTLTADGPTVNGNLTLPALANVKLTAQNADGSPRPGLSVQINDTLRGFFFNVGTTAADGTLLISGIQEGPFTIRAFTSQSVLAGDAAGTVNPADDGQTVNVSLSVATSGNVQGTVLAGDSLTPVPFAFIELVDAVTGQSSATTSTNPNGQYRFTNVTVGSQSFTVRVHLPSDFSTVFSQNGTFQ